MLERADAVRVVADPELLTTALGRLVHDGRRALAPVRARLENLDEAVVLELNGTGASPADPAAPTIGSRLTQRIVERHGGSFRTGSGDGAWWVRIDPARRPAARSTPLRVLFVGKAERGGIFPATAGPGLWRRGDGGLARGSGRAAAGRRCGGVRRLGRLVGHRPLSGRERHRVGWVLLSSGQTRGGEAGTRSWPARPTTPDFRGAIYAAHAKARLRLGLGPASLN